jgi:hypothetical protein
MNHPGPRRDLKDARIADHTLPHTAPGRPATLDRSSSGADGWLTATADLFADGLNHLAVIDRLPLGQHSSTIGSDPSSAP